MNGAKQETGQIRASDEPSPFRQSPTLIAKKSIRLSDHQHTVSSACRFRPATAIAALAGRMISGLSSRLQTLSFPHATFPAQITRQVQTVIPAPPAVHRQAFQIPRFSWGVGSGAADRDLAGRHIRQQHHVNHRVGPFRVAVDNLHVAALGAASQGRSLRDRSSCHDTRNTGQIARADDLREASGNEQRAHRVRLIVSVFHDQRAGAGKPGTRAGDDARDRAEAIPAGCERQTRLEADIAFAQMRVRCSDVRRVARDEVERGTAPRRRNAFVPIRLHELDVADG